MITYSVGVQVAWEISRFEAANKKSTFIEVDHIMLGLLSLDKVQKKIKLASDLEYKNLVDEKNALYKVLSSFDLDPTPFRRKLRKLIPDGNGLPSDNIYHRSEDCKKMFYDATYYAINYLAIKHLFLSAINWKTSLVMKLLNSERIDIDKLKSEIMFSFYRNN